MNISNISTLVSLTLGLLGFLSGAILWYRGSIEKRYAAERDFNHLKGNQQQMGQALAMLGEDMDHLTQSTTTLLEQSREMGRKMDLMDRSMLEINNTLNWARRNPDSPSKQ